MKTPASPFPARFGGPSSGFLTAVVAALLLTADTAPGQILYERLKSFGDPNQQAAEPWASVIEGSDGALYGTTLTGVGSGEAGAVFKVNKDGTGYQELRHFSAGSLEGASPRAGLVEGGDGLLYGTTEAGGTGDAGVLFKLGRDGTGYTVVHDFGSVPNQGSFPNAPLVVGTDGALYGSSLYGGSNALGTLFKVNRDGSGYRVLHHFGGAPADGAHPYAGMIEGTDGALYGTTLLGGSGLNGTVFKLNKDGTGYTVLFNFDGANGAWARGRLVEDDAGVLYGTTEQGGSTYNGTVFKLNKDGTGHAILRHFEGDPADVEWPRGTLTLGSDGALYGASGYGGTLNRGTVFKLNRDGSGYAVLLGGENSAVRPTNPFGGIIEGSDGRLYATSLMDWVNDESGFGTVFSLSKDGTGLALVHRFNPGVGDPRQPFAGVLPGSDGALYGTSVAGGPSDAGMVFRMDRDGQDFRVLHQFASEEGDGQSSDGLLIEGSDGALYGTTIHGGLNGLGTVFKLNKDGSGYTVLRSFGGSAFDASQPDAGVIEGSDGVLYGTTYLGGSAGLGTLFKLNKDGSSYAVLQSFGRTLTDAANPSAALLEGKDGALYGTTALGGVNGLGTVFKINKNGSGFVVLRSFSGAGGDGSRPLAPLLQAANGLLYGTTYAGGSANAGVVFKLNTNGGGYQTIHHFDLGANGSMPGAGLSVDSDGTLYGTASQGGDGSTSGLAFKLNPDGTGYGVIHRFQSQGANRGMPYSTLARAADGWFYGSTTDGGDAGLGSIFRFKKAPVYFEPPSVVEGNTSSTQAVIRITLSTPQTQTVSMAYATADGTAQAGIDYMATNGLLVFNPGETLRTIVVPVMGDRVDETDEVFSVNLSQPTNISLAFPQVVVTILDDDTALTISRQPADTAVRLGLNASFSLVATSTTPPIAYQWRFSGTNLPGATNATLQITNVQAAHEGAYQALVTDSLTSILSQPATLDVLLPPAVVQAPLSQSTVLGGSVTFSVQVTGDPPFTYELRHLSAPLFTNVFLSSQQLHFFTFNSVTQALGGSYRVVIRNDVAPNGVAAPTVSLTLLADADGDGLPDAWESAFGAGNAGADDDGDGFTNGEEYTAGTNPTNAASLLRLEEITRVGQTALRFTAMSNQTYTVLSKDRMDAEWTRLADLGAFPTNRSAVVTDPVAGTTRFYRLVTPRRP